MVSAFYFIVVDNSPLLLLQWQFSARFLTSKTKMNSIIVFWISILKLHLIGIFFIDKADKGQPRNLALLTSTWPDLHSSDENSFLSDGPDIIFKSIAKMDNNRCVARAIKCMHILKLQWPFVTQRAVVLAWFISITDFLPSQYIQHIFIRLHKNEVNVTWRQH